MTEHDKDLEDYLRGETRLSRAYRAASDEKAPAHLEEAILAKARAEISRKPSWNRVLAPVALAATMVLGVNLAWNLYQVEPVPEPVLVGESGRDRAPKRLAAPAAAAPPGMAKKESRAGGVPDEDVAMAAAEMQASEEKSAAPVAPTESLGDSALPGSAAARHEGGRPAPSASSAAPSKAREADSTALMGKSVPAAPPAADDIERLISWVQNLEDAVFILDGEEFTPPQAAVYLRIQWREAGNSVHTATDFIEKCARRSPATGEPYRFRFAGGEVRDAAEVLRERLP